MKILSIRIKNLASLSDEHFIDFESAPSPMRVSLQL